MGSRRATDLGRSGSLHTDAAAHQQAYMERAMRRASRSRRPAATELQNPSLLDEEELETGLPDSGDSLLSQRFIPWRDRSKDVLSFERNLRASAAYWQDLAITQLPAWAQQQGSTWQRHMQEMKQKLEKFSRMPLHPCSNGQLNCQHAHATGSARPVVVYGLGYSFELEMPSFSCSQGCPNFETPPVYLQCMGSTPIRPGSMFDISLLQLFHSLRWRAGASASAMSSSLEDVLRAMDLLGNGPAARRIDDKAFLAAYRQYRLTFRYSKTCGLVLSPATLQNISD